MLTVKCINSIFLKKKKKKKKEKGVYNTYNLS